MAGKENNGWRYGCGHGPKRNQCSDPLGLEIGQQVSVVVEGNIADRAQDAIGQSVVRDSTGLLEIFLAAFMFG
ncbi:hypothetical protein AVEN_27847-1 [Araneus ventricosus]|uniref:Uncharacterized protein n=1 Tax=Araneus ventricosus TaxID=182803 RepID=A0A4Y2M4X1_ARAVE|nr:hypothetical protein AVEN_27847-1 [Araneus ventricosus]